MKFLPFVAFAASFASASLVQDTLEGTSMLPLIEPGDRVTYETAVDFESLQRGDVIVYDLNGDLVCHALTEQHGNRWKAKGINNRFQDRGFVTRENFIGRVIYIEGKRI